MTRPFRMSSFDMGSQLPYVLALLRTQCAFEPIASAMMCNVRDKMCFVDLWNDKLMSTERAF
jgi:hypothetical protein